MADSINAQGLTFNPAFLQAMNTLSHLPTSRSPTAKRDCILRYVPAPRTA